MKRILSLIAMLCVLGVADTKAQTAHINLAVAAAEDTLTNTDTAYMRASFNGVYNLQFRLTMTKISGTVGGAAILQGTNVANPSEGDWFTLTGSDNGASSSQYQGASATISNATASYWWNVPKTQATYQYYRIRVITSGTQVSAPTGIAYYRK